MAQGTYNHLEPLIKRFFLNQGTEVTIEPRGSQGPDIESIKGQKCIGEIKHAVEIYRDIRKYWGDWNSNRSFGGKTSEYLLSTEFPNDVNMLEKEVKGWIAVIYGQLRHYCNSLPNGWLVCEGYNAFKDSIKQAMDYLERTKQISIKSFDIIDDVAFIHVYFD